MGGGRLRFTHLEAFWIRLPRLGAAGGCRWPGRAAGRGGPVAPAPASGSEPLTHASGPASAPAGARRGGKQPEVPVLTRRWVGGGARGAAPPPPAARHKRPFLPEPGLPKERNFGRGGGSPQPARSAPPRSLSRCPGPPSCQGSCFGGLRWGRHLPRGSSPPPIPRAGFAQGGETAPPSPPPGKAPQNPPRRRQGRMQALAGCGAKPTIPLNRLSLACLASQAHPAHTGTRVPPPQSPAHPSAFGVRDRNTKTGPRAAA